jgi:hypothetical protein
MLSRAQEWPLQAKFAEWYIVFDETGAVVATDTASADADHDNGAALHDPARLWQRDHAAPHVTQRTSEGVKAEQTADTQHAARRIHAPVHFLWSCFGSQGRV